MIERNLRQFNQVRQALARASSKHHIPIMCLTLKAALAACAIAMAPAGALAEGGRQNGPSVGAEIEEAINRALERLERLIEDTPMYEAPVITPDGDIIIRRKRPDRPPLPEGQRRT